MSDLAGQVAFGCAGLTFSEHISDDEAHEVIRAAYDAGIRVFDTARAYGTPTDDTHNERLLADALAGRQGAILGTKGGHFRTGVQSWDVENTPERLAADIELSRRLFDVETLDLFYIHRVDQFVLDGDAAGPAFAQAVTSLAAARDAGRIARIGLSNVSLEQLDAARAITRIDAVQNAFSPFGGDTAVLGSCAEHGIAHYAYSPLGGASAELGTRLPRTAALAAELGVSVQQLVLRALLDLSPAMSVVTGARRVESARSSAAVADLAAGVADEAFAADRAALV